MHAYGHQWACQLVYNPHLRKGLGLTEGEGTERIWSKFRKLIGVTRTSGVRGAVFRVVIRVLISPRSELVVYGTSTVRRTRSTPLRVKILHQLL